MEKVQVSYDYASVLASYAHQYPDRRIVGVYKYREAAFAAADGKPDRKIDLSSGFFVVFDEPTPQQPHTGG